MSLKCHSENPDSKIRLSTSQQKLELKYSNNFQNEEDPWIFTFFFPIDLNAISFPRKIFMQLDLFSLKYSLLFQKLFNLWWTFKQEKSRWSKNKLSDFSQILKMLLQNYDSCNLSPPPFSVAHFSSLTFQLLHKSRNINQLPFSLISSNLVSFPQNPKSLSLSLSRRTSKDSFHDNRKRKRRRKKKNKTKSTQNFLQSKNSSFSKAPFPTRNSS